MSVGEANKKAQRIWYSKNKQKAIDKQRNKRNELRKWFREEILPQFKCNRCSEDNLACIDFHHTDPSVKDGSVSEMLWKKFSKEKILNEISKCEPLCANCHRKHHWEDKYYGDSSNR